MPALDTVQKMVDYARVLLQDTIGAPSPPDFVESYRYSTTQLVDILNFAVMDARRLRPDLFLSNPVNIPFYLSVNDAVTIDQQYRLALVYFMVSHAHLRDEEDVQDARATMFMNKFSSMMVLPSVTTG